MLHTPRARRGMVTAPHHLASQAGLAVLREGGNAIEATVAMAAALAVVYPHMTSIGGDGFWLVAQPGQVPEAVEGCGAAVAKADVALYRAQGLESIPWRGPLAANTVAGTISGWGEVLKTSVAWGGKLPLSRLVEEAAWHAENGFAVTLSQAELTEQKWPELKDAPGFKEAFLIDGCLPREGERMKLPALGATLKRIGQAGTEDFYRGELARSLAADHARFGTPLAQSDLAVHQARRPAALSVALKNATLYNFAPPTQGFASLMILGLFDRLNVREAEGFAHIHGLVEATKQAFLIRDRILGDPDSMPEQPGPYLAPEALDQLVQRIDREKALPWPYPVNPGDTVWMGAIDGEGRQASFIQSIYFEFGSGCVLPESGIVWQNRGSSFLLSGKGPRLLAPGRRPFHTLNPAMARFKDGRDMVYGTMGGEGQPQTQSALFSRYGLFGQPLQQAITAPRWLLGKTWGENSVTLKLEGRFDPDLVAHLSRAGHDVEMMADFTATMGHAGAIVRHPDGALEGATDPRSDGAVAAF
ncbi:gamma-glutamyltransferase family protein [Ferrovibrio sp. MS7]|uniref:gamma-glutamyltransferase family protein n=1 Tax=Ferrovibrio plantarum TaxID=3119164 RepID=UPI0031367EF6